MLARDELDLSILDLLQNDFPLNVQPFREIAAQIGVSEEEVLNHIQVMKESGVIRRIGGIIDSRALDFHSTLCAMEVPESRLEEIGAVINALPGVTHNYQRDHKYNLWFTLTTPSEKITLETLQELEKRTGITIINMPAAKVYKIKVAFKMGGVV